MSNVPFEIFSQEFANDLGIVDKGYLTCILKEVPEYDSMGKITISLTIERLFGFQIPFEALDKVETIHVLYEYCIKNSVRE